MNDGENQTKAMTMAHWMVLFLLALIIKWPYHNEMLLLVQGDLGRDLYIYEQTLKGALIYRDYQYQYGPLMVYYNALCFKLMGVQVYSILIGQIVMYVLAGFFLCGTLVPFVGPAVSLLAAAWFLAFFPHFFHTFNHAGGIVAVTAVIFCLTRFFLQPGTRWLAGIAVALFAALLIKLNIGLAAWAGVCVSLVTFNWFFKAGVSAKLQRTGWLYLGGVIVLALGIYGVLVQGLPAYYVKQCFPWGKEYSTFSDQGPVPILKGAFQTLADNLAGHTYETDRLSKMPAILPHRVFFLLYIITLPAFFVMIRRYSWDRITRAKYLFTFVVFYLFALLCSHEFLSYGIYYQRFWVIPFVVLAAFFALGVVLGRLDPRLRHAVLLMIAGVILLEIQGKYAFESFIKSRPAQLMAYDKVNVYMENSPEWIQTVTQAADYLKAHLRKEEPFVAIPYDALYFYLTGSPSAIPQIFMFNSLRMPPEQEQDIIAALEKKNVRYVLISNRSDNPPEDALGKFGVSYGRAIAAYIDRNFEQAAAFGRWVPRPDWTHQHAVIIYQRKGEAVR